MCGTKTISQNIVCACPHNASIYRVAARPLRLYCKAILAIFALYIASFCCIGPTTVRSPSPGTSHGLGFTPKFTCSPFTHSVTDHCGGYKTCQPCLFTYVFQPVVEILASASGKPGGYETVRDEIKITNTTSRTRLRPRGAYVFFI